jgi:hypothetical protein
VLGKAAKTLLLRLRGFFWVYLGLGRSLTPSSFALVSVGVALEENYGAAGLERDRPNGPIGMPILRVCGLWAYAANKKETKERRYPESKVQRRPCSKARRVAAARGANISQVVGALRVATP